VVPRDYTHYNRAAMSRRFLEAAAPLTRAAVAWLKSREPLDTFDYDTHFGPIDL